MLKTLGVTALGVAVFFAVRNLLPATVKTYFS